MEQFKTMLKRILYQSWNVLRL